MSVVKQISKKIKEQGYNKTYFVRSYSMTPKAHETFDKIVARIKKYGERNGYRKVRDSHVMEHIIRKAKVTGKDFYNK